MRDILGVVPVDLDHITPAQRGAITHADGPLLVLAGAGAGKTATLVTRFAWLTTHRDPPTAPEAVLALAASEPAAAELRTRMEDVLGSRGFAELAVHTVAGFAARLLREEALEAGLDPFVVPATAADRLAVLLERMDELELRRHDLGGRPAATLARVIARIDRCKEELVDAAGYAAWAAALPDDGERTPREREFATLFEAHDRMLAERGLLDAGELVLRAHALLRNAPHVRVRTAARFRELLVDDLQDATPAGVALLSLLGADHGHVLLAGDDDQAVEEHGAPAGQGATFDALRRARQDFPGLATVTLERSFRCPARVVRAARAVAEPVPGRLPKGLEGRPGDPGEVRFWRCVNERAQAQGVAAEIERLVRDGVAPADIGVLVRSVRNEGQAVAVALDERAVPYRLVGAAAFFQRAEVRDVLAWLRLLADPTDAGAAVRALARPPVELRSIDLARCIQIARRRKLDMVSALVAATESPQLPPEARERILGFLKLHRQASAALDTSRPDLFVHRLIDRLGLRRQQLFAAQADVVERLVSLARLGELATGYTRRAPQATPREFARYLAAVADAGLRDEDEAADREAPKGAVAVLAMHAARGLEFRHVFVLGLQSSRMPGARQALAEPVPYGLGRPPRAAEPGQDSRAQHIAHMRRVLHVAMTRAGEGLVLAYASTSDSGALQPPSPFAEEAREALGAEWEDREEELFGPDEALHATFTGLRDELLGSVSRVGTRLGELRFDTDLDVTHGVTRYLELRQARCAAWSGPRASRSPTRCPDINARLLQAASAQQREVFQTSSLDELVLGAEAGRARGPRRSPRASEPSLEPFLPKRGDGLMLSASDIETYRSCPLKYKFARVFRIPSEPTLNQRFGILVHQVLERFHAGTSPRRPGGLDELLGLLDAGWRRGGFGDSDQERQLRDKAATAMRRYEERAATEDAEPVWLEKGFQFKLGPHVLRGRVDRVDRLPDGGYELIDYKTGRPKTTSQLRDDVQLSLYAVAAREAWELESSRQAYLYVLDDEKVRVPTEDIDRGWITDTVNEVADGILGQGFEPTPSYTACSMCDYRIACPAAER